MQTLTIILLPVAVFGLTYILRYTNGPFDVFLEWRKFMGLVYIAVTNDSGRISEYLESVPDKFAAKLVNCFWCLSTWVAMILAAIVVLLPGAFSLWLIAVFASVGLSGFIHDHMQSKED